MAYGAAVYDASGALIWDTDGILARLIGTGQISYIANETGTKTIQMPGLVSTDEVILSVVNSFFSQYTLSVSGEYISIIRGAGGANTIADFMIFGIRRQ